MKLQMGDVEVALTLPLRFQRQLAQVGGAAVVDLLQRTCAALERSEDALDVVETLASAAYERSWEKLHCGSWKSVESVWREAFGYASVLQPAACEKPPDARLGPFAMPETHQLIASVEKQLTKSEKPRLKLPREILQEKVVAPQLDFPVRKLEMPTLEDFRRNVMLNNKPVVITGAMEFWPALGRKAGPDRAWKDLRYLRRVAGFRTVPVEVGSSYLSDDWGQELMTVNEFLDRHIIPPLNNDAATETHHPEDGNKLGYLAQHRLFDQIMALGRDIITPDYCTVQRIEEVGEEENEDITVNGWFGPGGTMSPLHFDPKDNVLCQVVGAKYLRLYAPNESSKLYPVEGLLSNTSQVQVENPDPVQFPDFCRAKYVECVLREGEMLYIPPTYWHYVRSLSTSFSTTSDKQEVEATMSGLSLAHAELLKVGPVASHHSLRLLPVSKKKKKQKFAIGDEYGVFSSYQMKKGEPQNVYKSVTLAGPVACVTMGTSKGTEDKAFVAIGQHVHGFSKKGKEFFKFQSNLAEPLRKIHVYDNQLWTATDFTFNQYENGADKHSFVSPDRINDAAVVPVNHEQDFYGILGCQDRYIRVVKDSNARAKKAMAAPVTALCRVPTVATKGTQSSGQAQVIYGTAVGGLGLVTYNGDRLKNKWKTTLASKVNSNDASGDNGLSASSATINSIACFDINRDDHPEILVGRDDGRVEVYSFNANSGDVVKLFEHANSDSIRCVQGGIVATPGYEELVACTFSGRVLSFTTEPLDQPDDDDAYGRSRGTVQRETRIIKLRKEVAALEDKIARMSLQRGAKEKEYLPVAEDLVVNSKFQLNAALGAYDVSLEIPVSIQMIVLHSAVPLDLLENESNLAIVSKSPVDPANGTHFLATYRCLEPTHRLEFQVRTIEGQFGHVEATVVANTQPRSAQTVKFFVKPLSLHHRVNELNEAEEAEFQKPCNTLQLSGDFSLVQIHDWVSMCLPEVPGRLQSDEVTLRYRNTFMGSLLVCRYSKGEATFSTPSVSVIAILKEIITKEATARKATLNISLDIKKESVPVMLGYLRPLLDAKHALSSQVKLIDGLKELQLHEEDYRAWMAPEYQTILENSEKILAEFKLSPKALNYLAGILTDLYVDLCKFRGTNAKQNLPRLYQLVEHYHFDSLVEFYLRE
ncbi:Bardet-Biedl syndrome 7 protein [Phytophthora boehmeriae]|uniref:Bardet-Biedl syndrome 7 protein n=1 Tax=Phytophthora boehmeriae TaxID=109152 RepID=A0A8T1X9G1_9STRA|nr:Bardet-Biedl syndrome 7 protein [Phytophthora boehmeriae]